MLALSMLVLLCAADLRAAESESAVWVFFADKGCADRADTAAALGELSKSYNTRAIERRRARRTAPGLFDERDLPVHPAYIEQVLQTGAHWRTTTRWFNGISVSASRAQLAAIRALPFVAGVRPVAAGMRDPLPDAGDGADGGGIAGDFYGRSELQIRQINLEALHQAGFTGEGVIIGILDTGFRRTHAAFNFPGHVLHVVAEWDFVENDANTAPEPDDPPTQHEHGTYILGTLGAYLPGQLVGAAYDAGYILCKAEVAATETPVEEDYFVAGLEFIEANGGDVATSSLIASLYGYDVLDGETTIMTQGFNVATANGLHCFQAAGNDGFDSNPATHHLRPPADSYDVITVGAVDANGLTANFTSDGPTLDGRVKPEVLARGVSTATVSPFGDNSYATPSGTSLSTPLVAGAAACLLQAHPGWTIAELRGRLMYSARGWVQSRTFDRFFIRGYGIVDAAAARVNVDCNANGVEDAAETAGGQAPDWNGNGIPDLCERLGDLNCNRRLDNFDIDAFVLALTDRAAYRVAVPDPDCWWNADINGDHAVDLFDLDGFVDLLLRL